MLENVKNLKSHDKGNTIKVIYEQLEKLGYKVTDKVLNAMEYGNIPQNRERIYIVGFLDKKADDKFSYPEKIKLTKTIHDCLKEREVDKKYYYNFYWLSYLNGNVSGWGLYLDAYSVKVAHDHYHDDSDYSDIRT